MKTICISLLYFSFTFLGAGNVVVSKSSMLSSVLLSFFRYHLHVTLQRVTANKKLRRLHKSTGAVTTETS